VADKTLIKSKPSRPQTDAPSKLAALSIPDTLSSLHVNADNGLTTAEANAAIEKHGYNEVAEEKEHPVLRFLHKFWGISAWMPELILVLSAVLGNYADLAVVASLLLVNAVIGFLQERRAVGVVQALRKQLQVSARVLRDSTWAVLPSRELVPGDIVRVRPGDIVPADIKLLAGTLTIDQSALTGESKAADKVSGDVVSSGAIIRRGEGNGVVILTGANTYFGRTTELVQRATPKLHIEAVIGKVVQKLLFIVGVLLSIVVLLTVIRGVPLIGLLPLLLVLLMSAIPIALPVLLTVAMAVGSKDLAKRGVLVTRLSASEDAATMDVLCVDKTGTITMNQLAVTEVMPLDGASEADVIVSGALASQEADQDPMDLAFIAAAKERHVFDGLPVFKPISFAPFDAKNRRTEAVIEQNGVRIRVMKGAVRTIAEACRLEASSIAELESRVSQSAGKGYRTLAIARGSEKGPVKLLGLVSLMDPLRPDAKQLIATLRDLGIAVKLLTGDALEVADNIAGQVGLPNVRRISDLKEVEAKSAEHATDAFNGVDGFAEVFPEDKFLVVQKLQAAGHVTGMTGDGVNDAPALREAEVGIAVSTATDVAKGAASVVLTEPGLTNIVTLVEQGRTIYQRVVTWIINKMSHTILKASFVSIAYVATGKFVISAFAMLILTFVMDFATIALATDHVQPSKKPETWNIGGLISVAVMLGVAMVVEGLLLLAIGWHRFGLATNAGALTTFSYLLMLYFSLFSILNSRERHAFWSTVPSTPLIVAISSVAIAGTALTRLRLASLMPLPWPQTLAVFAYAMTSCLVLNDALKVAMIRWRVPANRASDASGSGEGNRR